VPVKNYRRRQGGVKKRGAQNRIVDDDHAVALGDLLDEPGRACLSNGRYSAGCIEPDTSMRKTKLLVGKKDSCSGQD
jgi:hypothetical protein